MIACRRKTAMIDPPACCHLPPETLPFWRSVAASLPADANANERLLAAHLARAQATIERLDERARSETDPRLERKLRSLANVVTRRTIALSRLLGIDGAHRHRREDVEQARQAERRARETMGALNSEMIPR